MFCLLVAGISLLSFSNSNAQTSIVDVRYWDILNQPVFNYTSPSGLYINYPNNFPFSMTLQNGVFKFNMSRETLGMDVIGHNNGVPHSNYFNITVNYNNGSWGYIRIEFSARDFETWWKSRR